MRRLNDILEFKASRNPGIPTGKDNLPEDNFESIMKWLERNGYEKRRISLVVLYRYGRSYFVGDLMPESVIPYEIGINAGGNVFTVYFDHHTGRAWKVEKRNPRDIFDYDVVGFEELLDALYKTV